MENEINEKLEMHDQLFDQLIKQVEVVEKREYPDYKAATAALRELVINLKSYLDQVKALVDTLLAMKIKHRLDLKTKGVIIVLAAWGIFTCLSVGLNISQHADNNTLRANSFKYRIIRQTYPIQADKADSIYQADPDAAEKNTIELEEKASQSDHAGDVAEQKEQDAKVAQKEAKTLKKETARARKETLSGNKTKHKN
ncbi:MAG: hypothetical protein JWR50_864 [Mucilaginibacter sp.]|nr:hypothetical protein [Mucilaginibacter sp.]